MKKMFKVLLFPIWLVLEVVVFVLKLMMVLSSTVLGILLRILIPMAFVAMLLSVRNGLMLLAFVLRGEGADQRIIGMERAENLYGKRSFRLKKTNGFFFDLKRRNDWQQHD